MADNEDNNQVTETQTSQQPTKNPLDMVDVSEPSFKGSEEYKKK